jgi:hypothetical protein
MSRHILLDSSPLGLLSNPARTPDVIAITQWSISCLAAGHFLSNYRHTMADRFFGCSFRREMALYL